MIEDVASAIIEDYQTASGHTEIKEFHRGDERVAEISMEPGETVAVKYCLGGDPAMIQYFPWSQVLRVTENLR